MAESLEVTPLNPRTFYVLLALAEGAGHGYAIAKSIEAATGGNVRLTPGILYPLIKGMLTDGWVAETSDAGDDVRRRCYRLTPRGRRIAQAEAQRLAALVRKAQACRLLPAPALG
ncbi:MAG: PadR family transcriptional regulator [Candidatus Eremiobacteraeota bacterium]|nr:PadR family transcriptional regulator [Candidatus Eremiobacteraeota bacterium]